MSKITSTIAGDDKYGEKLKVISDSLDKVNAEEGQAAIRVLLESQNLSLSGDFTIEAAEEIIDALKKAIHNVKW
jgi:hypothetical protein